ncbi:MAG TPA: FAD-binding oxidoreductase [Candidatus Limnocylindrales bacterium]
MTDTADVIIIGAGVHGTSLAFHLAERGTSVIVIERAWIGAGATGRSSGLVRMHYDLLAETRLAWASFPYFTGWAERVGGECGFTNTGFLWIEGADGEARVRANVASHRELGIDTSVVHADDIARLAPAMALDGDEVAAWEPASGYADPSVASTGFMRAARAMGARLIQGVEVTAVTTSEDGTRVTGVETATGSYSAPIVVNVAGAWAAAVGAMVGLEVPVTTWRHDTGYIGVPVTTPRPIPVVIDNVREMYTRPEGGDLLLIGLEDGSIIGGSPDRDTATAEPDFQDVVTDRIVRRLPALADGTFRAAHSGQDGLSPDQRSILGPAGPDGFYLDCGHSGTGFKTAPAIGLGMAELILDGVATSVDITPFEPGRFAAGRPLVGEHGGTPIWR